jgi:hypothetical protein
MTRATHTTLVAVSHHDFEQSITTYAYLKHALQRVSNEKNTSLAIDDTVEKILVTHQVCTHNCMSRICLYEREITLKQHKTSVWWNVNLHSLKAEN